MSAVNVSSVVAEIQAQGTAIAAVGGAVLLVLVVIKAFRWVRQALGGGREIDWVEEDPDGKFDSTLF